MLERIRQPEFVGVNMRIYCDNDNTLTCPIWEGNVVSEIRVRPKADWFLEQLSKHGEVYVITAANREYAQTALSRLGPAFKHVKGVISREDMAIVASKLADIEMNYDVDFVEKERLYSEIEPAFESGYLFDDYPIGGWLYRLKATVVGIDETKWIKVQPFSATEPDNGGLEQAYNEFLTRIGQ